MTEGLNTFNDLSTVLAGITKIYDKILYLRDNLDSEHYSALQATVNEKSHDVNIDHHLILFQIYVGSINRDYKKALKHLDIILSNKSKLKRDDAYLIKYYKGRCFEELDNYNDAIEIYSSLLKQKTLFADYFYRLYRCYYKIENRQQAIKLLKKHVEAIKKRNHTESVIYNLFELYRLYMGYNEYKSARNVLKKIEDESSKSPNEQFLINYLLPFHRATIEYEVAENMRKTKSQEAHYKKAIDILLDAIKNNKEDEDILASCYYDIALYYSRLDDSANALEYSNKVEDIYKRKIKSHSNSPDDKIALYKSICRIIRNSLVYLCESYSEDNTNTFLTEVDNKLNIAQKISSSYSIQTYDIRDLGVSSVKKIYQIRQDFNNRTGHDKIQYILIRLTLECDKLLDKLKFNAKVADYPLFHYTSFDNLRFILSPLDPCKTANINTLRASHSSQLNDSLEGYLFRDLLENSCSEASETLNSIWECYAEDYQQTNPTINYDVFILCFSKCVNRDFLPMWSMYGNKGDGINISIKFDKLKSILENQDYIQNSATHNSVRDEFPITETHKSDEIDYPEATQIQSECELFEVAYLNGSNLGDNIIFQRIVDLIRLFDNLIKSIDISTKQEYIEYIAQILNPLRFVFKTKSYEYENEIRVIITNEDSDAVFNWRSLKEEKFFHMDVIQKSGFNVLLGPKFKYSLNDELIAKLRQAGASSVDVSTINYR